MHARRTLRGLAAALLSAALVSGGVLLAAPAGYAESLPAPEAVASPAEESQEPDQTQPEAAEADLVTEPADEEPASEEPEAEASQSEAEPSADDASLSFEVAKGTGKPAAGAELQSVTAAVPAVSDVSLEASVVAIVSKKSLTVATEATGFGDDVDEIEAALIEKDSETDLSTEGGYAAIVKPSPSVESGEASFELVAQIEDLDRTKQYEVLLWKRGEDPSARENIYARVDLKMSEAQWNRLFGTTTADPAWNAEAAVGSFDWGIKKSFRDYIRGPIAHGSITVQKPATGTDLFKFPQTKNTWNPKTDSGTVQFAGLVNMKGHEMVGEDFEEFYALYLEFANPLVTVKANGTGDISIEVDKKKAVIATFALDASSAKKKTNRDGSIRYSGIKTYLTKYGADEYFANDTGNGPKGTFYKTGDRLDDFAFTVGADAKNVKPVDPDTGKNGNAGNNKKPKPATPTKPSVTATGSQSAGSLSWGISSYFAAYTTQKSGTAACPTPSKHCAGGSIVTSGVGAGYLFPQAAGGAWNTETHTGTVQFSGVVTFQGYGVTMFQVANPAITVTGPASATLSTGYAGSYGPSSVPLDLGSATKTVGSGGEVTWSNVPVQGGLNGVSAGQSAGFDSLTFTVGAASSVGYGSTQAGADATPAAAPPATTGITILTDAEKLVAGGRIEIEASGFEPDEDGILVVIYSDPVVLDEDAKADANGVVRWSGTLPRDLSGTHTITLQGSVDAGAVIDIQAEDAAKKSAKQAAQAGVTEHDLDADRVASAGIIPAGSGGMSLWEWWASALGLVAIAACTTLLAVRQRRAAE
jgi:hypothetical protein